ncbi:MAG TPA: hypothetical protein VMU07_02000 [Candidatus Paceibacterota bacterium]|nr:hypothetical protein [Candidatus Paceibacterota bacterium]
MKVTFAIVKLVALAVGIASFVAFRILGGILAGFTADPITGLTVLGGSVMAGVLCGYVVHLMLGFVVTELVVGYCMLMGRPRPNVVEPPRMGPVEHGLYAGIAVWFGVYAIQTIAVGLRIQTYFGLDLIPSIAVGVAAGFWNGIKHYNKDQVAPIA